jgi:hypothetical protein
VRRCYTPREGGVSSPVPERPCRAATMATSAMRGRAEQSWLEQARRTLEEGAAEARARLRFGLAPSQLPLRLMRPLPPRRERRRRRRLGWSMGCSTKCALCQGRTGGPGTGCYWYPPADAVPVLEKKDVPNKSSGAHRNGAPPRSVLRSCSPPPFHRACPTPPAPAAETGSEEVLTLPRRRRTPAP